MYVRGTKKKKPGLATGLNIRDAGLLFNAKREGKFPAGVALYGRDRQFQGERGHGRQVSDKIYQTGDAVPGLNRSLGKS